MSKGLKEVLLLALGVVCAIWIGLYVAISFERLTCIPAIDLACLREDWPDFGNIILLHWVERGQTLIAGVLAIGAAFIGGHYISRQIEQADAIETKRIRRRQLAIRATLPLTLSVLTEYADEVVGRLIDVYNQAVGERIPHPGVFPLPIFPQLPSSEIETLKEFIEFSSDEIGQPFVAMISDLQILNSRLRGLRANLNAERSTIVLKVNVESEFINAAKIAGRAADAFPYARRETDSLGAEVSWQSVRRALWLMSVREGPDYADLYSFMQRREDGGHSP